MLKSDYSAVHIVVVALSFWTYNLVARALSLNWKWLEKV